MKHFRWKPIATIAILILTVVVFYNYYRAHPEIKSQLVATEASVLISLIGLYLLGVLALAGITVATLRLCHIKLPPSESFLLTAYSSVINFFGPLQSGPAFRGVYLKARHNVNLKSFAAATLVYYFFFGAISGLMLISGVFKWWTLGLAVLAVVATLLGLRLQFVKRKVAQIDLRGWNYLALATFLQIVIVNVIYFVELKSIAPDTSVFQSIIYTGAANLSLFVSITPGAIGFRESFLFFSQQLHGISSEVIVAASILDRSIYILLMLLLAVFIFGSHAHRRLAVTKK